MKHKVFVYGTLRPGNTETVKVPGRLYSLGWYPGIVLGGDGGTEFVTCEVIEVTGSDLLGLDLYEGYDPDRPDTSLYLRVPYQDGFIYVYNHPVDDNALIPSGDWLEFTGKDKGSNAWNTNSTTAA